MNCKYARLLMIYRIDCHIRKPAYQKKTEFNHFGVIYTVKKHFVFVLKMVLIKIFGLNF